MILRVAFIVAGATLGICGWIFWFMAYRDADRRAREADELLNSLAIKIVAQDVPGAIPIAKAIVKRAGLAVRPKKGPPHEAA